MRREEVIGQHLPIRQREDGDAVGGEKTQLRAASFKLARIGGDDDVQPLIRARSLRKRQRRSAAVELPPLDARLRVCRDRRFKE